MKVYCHHLGGYAIHGITLKHGQNVVDDEAWAEAIGRLAPKMRAGLLEGKTPTITVGAGPAEQPTLPLAPARAPALVPAREAEPMLAKDVIALVEAATEPDELERFADGETRKTVLAAIKKRATQLAEAAA